MTEQPTLSVVIPAYYEEKNLPEMFDALRHHLDPLALPYEVIVVDDGSQDATWPVIQNAAQADPRIRGIRLSRNFGKEAAMYAGLEMARGQAVIMMDGDLQHPPELLPDMIAIWREAGADVVDARKIDRGRESLLRKAGAYLFYKALQVASGYELSGLSDFKLLDRKVVDAWLALPERNRFYRGMVEWLGFKHVELTFVTPQRSTGSSSWSVFGLAAFAVDAITSFSSRPLQLVTYVGILFFIGALALTGRVIWQLVTGTAVSGFATVIILLLIIGSAMLFGLGLIGIYLAKIYTEVKQRPIYIHAEKTETTTGGPA